MKKYELTNESMDYCGSTLHRIRALKDFECQGRQVKTGDLGGWIEQENNLSQDGCCWVSGNARVSGNAWVYGDAEVYGDAWVSGNAEVYGDAWVSGDARVYGNAEVSEKDRDLFTASYLGSRQGTTTFFRNSKGGISVACGCFIGTLEEFEEAVATTHGNNKYGKEYRLAIELAKIHMEVEE